MVDPVVANAAASHITGYMLNMILYGILILQTRLELTPTPSFLSDLYYVAFPHDARGIKILVYGLFIIETAQSVMMLHDAITVFGLNFGDTTTLRQVHLAWLSIPILSCTASSIVQTFFAWRIYVLGDSIFIPLSILTIVLVQVGSGIAQGVFSFIVNDYTNLPKVTAAIWLVSAAVCDVLIAVCMTYILSRKQTAFRSGNILLARIIKMTIETGAITAVMAVITAALDLGMPNNNYFVPPSYILGKLYANNLIVILNSRIRIDGSRDYADQGFTTSSSMSLSSPSFSLRARQTPLKRHKRIPSTIHEQERYSHDDISKDPPFSPGLRSIPPVMLSSPSSKEHKPFDV